MESIGWKLRPLGWVILIVFIGSAFYFGATIYFRKLHKQAKTS